MKKILKAATVLLLAAVVVVSGNVFAYAQTQTYEAYLYKDGTYGTDSAKLSMGNDAVLDAEVTTNSNGDYIIAIGFTPKFKAYGFTAGISEFTLEGYDCVTDTSVTADTLSAGQYYVTRDANHAVILVTINYGSVEPIYPLVLNTSFKVDVLLMNFTASADIVITK